MTKKLETLAETFDVEPCPATNEHFPGATDLRI